MTTNVSNATNTAKVADAGNGTPGGAGTGTPMDEATAALWHEFKQDQSSQELRNKLIEKYLPLVRYNAERVWAKLPEGVDLNDLMSAGVFGLMDAIEAFDLERGVKFETYCVPRIRGAMLDELRTMDWVPRLVRSKASKLEAARKQAEAEFGRPPSDTELAERMKVTLDEFDKMKSEASAVNLISLNKKWYETDSYKDVREVDILEDSKGEDPTRGIQRRDLMRLVTKGLNRNERLIVILYYYEELTMKEIGNTLGLSESRVSQMHSSIVSRLKDQLSFRRPEFG
jgi:RNA polymerase sigma factor for flagellar operon FliA